MYNNARFPDEDWADKYFRPETRGHNLFYKAAANVRRGRGIQQKMVSRFRNAVARRTIAQGGGIATRRKKPTIMG